MKKTCIILLMMLLSPVYALPPWFKEGTYVIYVAFPYKDRPFPTAIILTENDTLLEAYGNVTLTFNITRISGSIAYINVTLKLLDVEIKPGGKHFEKMAFFEVLTLDLKNLMYIENGTPVGKPVFFIDPKHPFQLNETIFGTSMRVENVTPSFLAPIVYAGKVKSGVELELRGYNATSEVSRILGFDVEGTFYNMMDGVGKSTYDNSTGLLLCNFPPTTYEMKKMGLRYTHFYDQLAMHRFLVQLKRREVVEKNHAYCGRGMNLYKTNIPIPFEEYVWVEDEKNWRRILIGVIGILTILIVLVKIRR
ncbi:hypothetical protein OCC_09039 [Thermococcus litoralis DSM 5473]|jgi:hypothetical protein|uniref:Uncharacterized protein n=1 Tax=Thermococcus litoralis (strain ATCC 51850 / DSM 5473 / JCM 8560 / NS-C) TaxID=523849 RepID=H3ZKC8_THELN|nr:hypothetical protein [Thermococcus litoralis]EHR79530.1 hypothetical protein OCC_09039 [Thermococcus litoralis DSM 5473]